MHTCIPTCNKKKDYIIAYIFIFYQSTHTININIKSQFLAGKNYLPFVLSTEI